MAEDTILIVRCENCAAVLSDEALIPLEKVADLAARIEPGSVVPAGACPHCQSLAYLATKTVTIQPGEKVCPNCGHGEFVRMCEDRSYGSIDEDEHILYQTKSDVIDTGAIQCGHCDVIIDDNFKEIVY